MPKKKITLEEFNEWADERIAQAIQSGKAENSGLIAMIVKKIDEEHHRQKRLRERLYLIMCVTLILIYVISAIYVFSVRVTPENIKEYVDVALTELIEVEWKNTF